MIDQIPLPPSSGTVFQVNLGSILLVRGLLPACVHFIESGSVVLGVVSTESGELLEHQVAEVHGPAWLEAGAGVLGLPSVVDAVAATGLRLRQVPLAEFQDMVCTVPAPMLSVLQDIARAHRQQTEFAISRVARDAEARCAEWLLSHAQSTEKGDCSVMFLQRKRMIAAQLGIAPETLSRVLRHLRERRLISGSGRVVNLVDPSGLRSLAGV
jgi:CRP-like cAMP-binding protein